MPVNANILAGIQPFSLPDVVGSAEQTNYLRVRNELLGYQADEQSEIAKRRAKRKEIEQLFAGMPARIEEYRRLGMHEEAEQTIEALLNAKRQEYAMFNIIADGLQAHPPEERGGYWKQIRQQGLESGMLEPNDMPDELDQAWIDHWLGRVKGELDKMELTYGEPPSEEYPEGRTMTQDRVTQGGEFIEELEPYEAAGDVTARTGESGSGRKPWQMTAGDTNSIRNHAAMIFGGHFDPTTDKYIGILEGKELMVTQLAERASEIYNEAKGQIPHDVAIAQAAREQGQVIPQTGSPDADDPLRIRP